MHDLRLYTRRRAVDPSIVVAIFLACAFAVMAAAISVSIAPDAVVPGASTPTPVSIIAGGTRG